MGIVDARNYIATRLTANSLTEVENPFNDGNTPQSLIDNSFVTVVQSASGAQLNNDNAEIDVSVSSDVYLKGFRDVYEAYQTITTLGETLIKDILTASNQSAHCINGVQFSTMEITPFENEANDNILVLNLVFNVRTFINL